MAKHAKAGHGRPRRAGLVRAIPLGLALPLVAVGACRSDGWPRPVVPATGDAAVEARVDSLLARMSVEEKVGQVIQADVRRVTAEDVRRYHLGSVLNGGGGFPGDDKHATVADWLALADMLWDASTDTTDGGVGVPAIWGVDAVHGHNNVIGATIFPHNVGLGAANDSALVRRIAEVVAREVRVTGHDWNFGPTLAVPRDTRWGRAYEGYSEDPAIVTAYSRAMVEGLQGAPGSPGFLDDHHVIATAKHFIADGGTHRGRDQGDFRGTTQDLIRIHGPPYVAAIEAGVQAIMVSFSSWNGLKMHANRGLLTDVLKDTLAFDGLLVGDWNAHGQIPGCTNGSCPEALAAGLDMYMVPDDWRELYDSTLAQVRSGAIPMARLDDAVRRILRVKVRAGVFERGRPSTRPLAGDTTVLGAPAHRALAREAVRRSLVLLKNNGAVLPIRAGARVLVAGDGAHDIGKQSGGWTLTWQGTGNDNGDFPGATSVWQGLDEALRPHGGEAILSPEGRFEASAAPDVAVVVFGEDPYAEFQGDRHDLDFESESALALMRSLNARGIPVVAVFVSGRPLWVTPELNAADAFVMAWLPGSEGGGIADVLVGDREGRPRADFRGRLSFSWPRAPDQADRDDPAYDPLFPLGYGLTYARPARLPVLPEEAPRPYAADRPVAFFTGGSSSTWQLTLRGADGRTTRAIESRSESTDGALIVGPLDHRLQEDARSVHWVDGERGGIFLESADGADYGAETTADLAVAFNVRVTRPPEPGTAVSLVAAAGAGDARRWVRLDVSDALAAPQAADWVRLGVSLRCLERLGLDVSNVTVPWGMEAQGEVRLGFSDVRLERADRTLPCPAASP